LTPAPSVAEALTAGMSEAGISALSVEPNSVENIKLNYPRLKGEGFGRSAKGRL
jgi:hypothetical protein